MVRSLERGLDVLAALNEHNGSPVGVISDAIKLHRTTVYRLLETLREAGYVRRSDSDNSYRLTLKVRALSEGFDDEAWVSAIAAPVLGELLRKVSWPSDLATFSGGAMVIRETTHRFSPFSIHHAMVGKSLPLLTSAVGRAYLAFCPDQEREVIVEHLVEKDVPGAGLVAHPEHLRRLVAQVRRDGYAASLGEVESKMNTIAVPVLLGSRVFACINIVMFKSAMPLSEAVERYLPDLRRAAQKVEEGLLGQSGLADAPIPIESAGRAAPAAVAGQA